MCDRKEHLQSSLLLQSSALGLPNITREGRCVPVHTFENLKNLLYEAPCTE